MSKSACEEKGNCLDFFDNLHSKASNATRVNNIDVVTTDYGEEIGICHIPVFGFWGAEGVQGLLGVYLALKHLNDGNGEVISILDGINSKCNIRFTTEFFDTNGSG